MTVRVVSAGQKQLDSRTVIDSDDAIYTRRKLDLEEGGILRVTGYGLSCEFTLSAMTCRSRYRPIAVAGQVSWPGPAIR